MRITLLEDYLPRLAGLAGALVGSLVVSTFDLHAGWLFVAIVFGWLYGSILAAIALGWVIRRRAGKQQSGSQI